MPHSKLIVPLLLILAAGSDVHAQPFDWKIVENLKGGSRITVKAQQKYFCLVNYVTPDELVCTIPALFRRRTITIPRDEIREIRLERSPEKHIATGAAIGAGVGAIAGATRTHSGFGAFIGAVAAAGPGGTIGGIVGMFRRGKVIYEAKRPPSKVSQPPTARGEP